MSSARDRRTDPGAWWIGHASASADAGVPSLAVWSIGHRDGETGGGVVGRALVVGPVGLGGVAIGPSIAGTELTTSP